VNRFFIMIAPLCRLALYSVVLASPSATQAEEVHLETLPLTSPSRLPAADWLISPQQTASLLNAERGWKNPHLQQRPDPPRMAVGTRRGHYQPAG
jgi:hypothetical protein